MPPDHVSQQARGSHFCGFVCLLVQTVCPRARARITERQRDCRYTNVDTARIAAISCSHSPFTSPVAHARLMDLLDDVGQTLTHFVHCGDLLEAAAASVHAGEHDHTLADEFEHASNFLRSIREALPKGCRLIWMNGNHDDNIFKRDPRRIPKALRDMIEIGRDSRWPEFSKWAQYPYAKNQRGQVQIAGGLLSWLRCRADFRRTGSPSVQQLHWRSFSSPLRAWSHPPTRSTNPMPANPQSTSAILVCERGYSRSAHAGMGQPYGYLCLGCCVLIAETKTDRPNRLCAKNWNAELIRLQEI